VNATDWWKGDVFKERRSGFEENMNITEGNTGKSQPNGSNRKLSG